MTWSEIALDPPGLLLAGKLAAPDQGGKEAGSGARAGGLDQLANWGRLASPGLLIWPPGLVANSPSSWMGRPWAK